MLSTFPTQHALLAQLAQRVADSRLQPEQCDLQPVLTLLLTAIAPLPIAQQLEIAGYVFEQLAGVVNERASLMLAAWESWHSTQAPVIDLSGDADLFVQSQALDVADLFAVALPTPYPSVRQSLSGRGSAFEEGDGLGLGLGFEGWSGAASSEADDTLEGEGEPLQAYCGLEPMPLDETEMLTALQALSHGENIPQWSTQVSEGMQALTSKARNQDQALPLLSLQQSLHMPLVEVWLALLLGDTGYQLTRSVAVELEDFNAWSEAFYSGAGLQVVALNSPPVETRGILSGCCYVG